MPTIGTGYIDRSKDPEIIVVRGRVVGTGASAPTKVSGSGWTISRTGAGVYKITFLESLGTLIGISDGIQAATPGDNKGHTIVWDTLVTTTPDAPYIELNLFDSAFNAEDLEASEWLFFRFEFQRTSVSG